MTDAGPAADIWCRGMLPRVSRTFALGIRLLPTEVERPVRTAYLLCRIADTIEDAPGLPVALKRRLLESFGTCLDGNEDEVATVAAAFPVAQNDEERLVGGAALVLTAFQGLRTAERDAIRPRVQEMAAGMAEFAGRRGGDGKLTALATVEDLERYCYFVAGTVGHLLTGLFQLHHASITNGRLQRLRALAPSFGLGLQLTNIIKDVADDRGRGWSFVPSELCRAAGIRPDQLQDAACAEGARRVMGTLIAKARTHLGDALAYSLALPRTAYRVRIFCLTSLYFALRTLRLAEGDPRLLDAGHKVKITRGAVYRTVAVTHLVAPFDRLVRGYYAMLAHGWNRSP